MLQRTFVFMTIFISFFVNSDGFSSGGNDFPENYFFDPGEVESLRPLDRSFLFTPTNSVERESSLRDSLLRNRRRSNKKVFSKIFLKGCCSLLAVDLFYIFIRENCIQSCELPVCEIKGSQLVRCSNSTEGVVYRTSSLNCSQLPSDFSLDCSQMLDLEKKWNISDSDLYCSLGSNTSLVVPEFEQMNSLGTCVRNSASILLVSSVFFSFVFSCHYLSLLVCSAQTATPAI